MAQHSRRSVPSADVAAAVSAAIASGDAGRDVAPTSLANGATLAGQSCYGHISAEQYNAWMKICTDNKINSTNSWDVDLINFFHAVTVDPAPSAAASSTAAALGFTSGSTGQINFQVASCTLDGCVKVYSTRVDSLSVETNRLLTGLAASYTDPGKETAGSDAAGEDGTGVAPRKRTTRTLEENEANLSAKGGDIHSAPDPLFQKTTAEFDEGGVSGLLLNTLSLDFSGRVVFDTSAAAPLRDQVREAGQIAREPQLASTDRSEAIARLRESFLPLLVTVDRRDICPTFKNWSFAELVQQAEKGELPSLPIPSTIGLNAGPGGLAGALDGSLDTEKNVAATISAALGSDAGPMGASQRTPTPGPDHEGLDFQSLLDMATADDAAVAQAAAGLGPAGDARLSDTGAPWTAPDHDPYYNFDFDTGAPDMPLDPATASGLGNGPDDQGADLPGASLAGSILGADLDSLAAFADLEPRAASLSSALLMGGSNQAGASLTAEEALAAATKRRKSTRKGQGPFLMDLLGCVAELEEAAQPGGSAGRGTDGTDAEEDTGGAGPGAGGTGPTPAPGSEVVLGCRLFIRAKPSQIDLPSVERFSVLTMAELEEAAALAGRPTGPGSRPKLRQLAAAQKARFAAAIRSDAIQRRARDYLLDESRENDALEMRRLFTREPLDNRLLLAPADGTGPEAGGAGGMGATSGGLTAGGASGHLADDDLHHDDMDFPMMFGAGGDGEEGIRAGPGANPFDDTLGNQTLTDLSMFPDLGETALFPEAGGSEYGDELVAKPRTIHRIAIEYARTAKRVDIKRLKKHLWSELEETIAQPDRWSDLLEGIRAQQEAAEEASNAAAAAAAAAADTQEDGSSSGAEGTPAPQPGHEASPGAPIPGDLYYEPSERTYRAPPDDALPFSAIMSSLRNVYPPKRLSEISAAYCFICLLHLANEHGLDVRDSTGLDDLYIVAPEGTPAVVAAGSSGAGSPPAAASTRPAAKVTFQLPEEPPAAASELAEPVPMQLD